MDVSAAVLAGRALYINELTRRDPRWGDWVDQSDNSSAAPEVSKLVDWVLRLNVMGLNKTVQLI